MHAIAFHTLVMKRPEEFLARVRGHYLAVSTSLLYGSIKSTFRSNTAAVETYEQVSAVLHDRRPVDRTTTFLIYDFTESAENGRRTGQAQRAEALESLTRVLADRPR